MTAGEVLCCWIMSSLKTCCAFRDSILHHLVCCELLFELLLYLYPLKPVCPFSADITDICLSTQQPRKMIFFFHSVLFPTIICKLKAIVDIKIPTYQQYHVRFKLICIPFHSHSKHLNFKKFYSPLVYAYID